MKESGPAVVSIFRPAMIIGSRHTPWLLEKLLPAFSFMTPAKYRSITVEQIARAMIATSLHASQLLRSWLLVTGNGSESLPSSQFPQQTSILRGPMNDGSKSRTNANDHHRR